MREEVIYLTVSNRREALEPSDPRRRMTFGGRAKSVPNVHRLFVALVLEEGGAGFSEVRRYGPVLIARD